MERVKNNLQSFWFRICFSSNKDRTDPFFVDKTVVDKCDVVEVSHG